MKLIKYFYNVIKEFISFVNFFIQISSASKIILLLIFSLILVILETFTLSLVYNASSTILLDNFSSDNILLKYITSKFEISKEKLPLYLISILLAFVFIKNIFQIFVVIFKNSFFVGINAHVTKKVYKKFLLQNYNFFQKKNSTELSSTIIQDIGLMMRTIESIFSIFIETALISIIFLYLLFLDPLVAIIISIGSILFFTFHVLFTKKRLLLLSKQRQVLNETILKDLQQSFNSFKEILIYSLEKFFINSIYLKFKFFFNNIKITNLLQLTTRIIIEQAFIILIFISFFLNIVILTREISEVIAILVVYLFGFLRILPSLHRLLIDMQSYIYGKLFTNKIRAIFDLTERNYTRTDTEQVFFNNEITFNEVNYKFDNGPPIFENLNITIEKNQKIGILGESGSGKTTFLNLMMGFLNPDNGEIKVDEKDINNFKFQWLNLIGYVPQGVTTLDDTIKKNITFQDDDKEIDLLLLKKSIKISGLEKLIKKNNLGMEMIIGEKGSKISGGELLRVGLARALYSKAEVLILDEFTSALDEESENEILETIKDINKTCIIVSHKKNMLKFCDKVFELKNKKLNEN